MLPTFLPWAQEVPAITVGVNPDQPPPLEKALQRPLSSLGQQIPPSILTEDSLPELLHLEASLDLSDTGGFVTGNPDTDPLEAEYDEEGGFYAAYNLTVDGIGADIYILWNDSSWYVSVITDGGLSWTGIGSSNATSPTGTYTTAAFSEAGSGSVLVSVV